MQDEPGALNLILEEQFKARIQALMTKSSDLDTLVEQLGAGGSLRIVVESGRIADARMEMRGEDVSQLVRAIFRDEGLKWLVARLEKGSLRIVNKTNKKMGLRVERDLDIDRFGYVK